MATELHLSWEWSNERLPDHTLAIKIDDLKPHSAGFPGLKRSPSFVTNLPDPMALTGTVVAGEASLAGKRVNLVLPELELGNVSAGDIVAVGVLDTGICICLEPIPGSEIQAGAWLEQWQCSVKD